MGKSSRTDRQILELERRRRVAESLREILAVLNSNLPFEEILELIVDQAHRLLGADAAAVYRLQPGGFLTLQASNGLDAEFVALSSIPLEIFTAGRAAAELEPIHIPDLAKLSLDLDGNTPHLGKFIHSNWLMEHLSEYYRSIHAFPLVTRPETYGMLTLFYHQPDQATQEQLGLAEGYAGQASLAIENARLRVRVGEEAVAAERTRLARELHDSVTQMLFSASLIADVLPAIWERNPAEARQGLDDLRQLTHGALAEMRAMLLELRPMALDETSLDELLRQLTAAISGRLRVPVNLEINGCASISKEVRVPLYRIAQEALNNAVKYAGACRVDLILNCSPALGSGSENARWVEMIVRDDGCGFDPGAISPEHLGLSIMKERAQSIGAILSVHSEKDHGTEIRVTWGAQEG
jgi:two-component system nitrate/nitrite sensor histidine kinase NarX